MVSTNNVSDGAVYFVHTGLEISFAKLCKVHVPTVTGVLQISVSLFFGIESAV